MASFIVKGIDVIGNPSISTNSTAGQDGAGQMTLLGGTSPFAPGAIVEFITQNETTLGELSGSSSFIGIKVYADAASYSAGIVQYNYVPQNPGQSANIQSDVSGLGDTYVKFNAGVLVSSDAGAPKLGSLFVAPGTNAGDNIGTLVIDRHTDQDLNGDGVIDSSPTEDGNGLFFVGDTVICFTPGTLIVTKRGEIPVELLRVGDTVLTRDNGPQQIRWCGMRRVSDGAMERNETLRPVLIRAGTFGDGMPERDMIVSPRHRMLVRSNKVSLYFHEPEVLVAAKHLIGMPGVERAPAKSVIYIHFMCDRHEVVMANGVWTETYQPGDHSLRGMDSAQRNEVLSIFPELSEPDGMANLVDARRTLKRHEAAMLLR